MGLILAAGFLFAMVSCSSTEDIKLLEGFEPLEPPNERPDLVYCLVKGEEDNKCSNISKDLCTAMKGEELEPGKKCGTGNYGAIPEFTCGWDPDTVARGDLATLSLTLKNEDPNCEPMVIYGTDSLSFDSLGKKVTVDYTFFESHFYGYLHCIDTSGIKLLESTSEYQLCSPLVMSLVSAPDVEGDFAINTNWGEGLNYYYYKDSIPSITRKTLKINNPDKADCTGDVEYKFLTSDTKTAGNIVEAVATANCNGEEKVLRRITATVVPDPVMSDCVWDSTGMGIIYDTVITTTTRRYAPIMHENQILKVSAKLDTTTSYGRCGGLMLYSFNGASVNSDSTLSLKDLATWGGSTRQLLSAKAVAPCPRYPKPIEKTCSGVSDIYVAYHVNKKGDCGDESFAIKSGITIFEFACKDTKSLDSLAASYYISCGGDNGNFTVAADGGTTPNKRPDGNWEHNGWNFYPGLPAVKNDSDNLYHYPVPAIIRTNVSAGLTCEIW
jgi:hypothetical protein